MAKRTCTVTGCANKHYARGYCSPHYQRVRAAGTVGTAPIQVKYVYNPEGSFAGRTEWRGEHLIWTGATDGNGYGAINVYGSRIPAHRYAWERVNGPIPEGLVIDHLCFTLRCVNVKHLRLATSKQNNENKSGLPSNNKSGHRGVSWNKDRNKWVARVEHDGRTYQVGYFEDLDEAAEAARVKRLELFTHNSLDRRASYRHRR